ncbi:hypothetical protein FB460_1745 [Propioniferax innocua]|uniref:Uncharacterized protein n=1 Tax=Propioniferax innocua TaxID=1753 RepID=A0A542ZC90_9ACTN|nr:hypothetical protein FB460_1745 [Propioniferax innocua]
MARSPHCSTARADFERHTCSPAPSLVLGAGPILGCLRVPCFEEPVFLGACVFLGVCVFLGPCVFLGVCVFLGPRVPRRRPAFRGGSCSQEASGLSRGLVFPGGVRPFEEARVPWEARVSWVPRVPSQDARPAVRGYVMQGSSVLPLRMGEQPHPGCLHVDRCCPSRADGRRAVPGAGTPGVATPPPIRMEKHCGQVLTSVGLDLPLKSAVEDGMCP